MTQAYQNRNYTGYDAMQRSERRPSHGSLVSVDRGLPYVSYAGRADPRHESRTYALPTPIHDLNDSDHGSARKRTSVACGRCRRRKIKCSGGQPCNACHNAGIEPSACMFHRVGTNQIYDLDTSVGSSTPVTPISPYSPNSPSSAYPAPFSAVTSPDERPAAVSWSKPGYPHSYDSLETPTSTASYAVGEDSQSWGITHRPSTTMGYYEQGTPLAYDYSTPLARISSNASEPLSPLNMSTLQSSLPLPLDRRLPAPGMVGSPMTPETSDLRNPVGSRLSSMCISSAYSRSTGSTWPNDASALPGAERRQHSIQDLADASVMLAPVTRGLSSASAPLTAAQQEPASLSGDVYAPSQSGGNMTSAAASQQSYFTSGGILPPLTTSMLPPTNYARYTSTSAPSTSLHAIDGPASPESGYYSWTTSAPTADTPLVVASIEAQQPKLPPTEYNTTSASHSRRYPSLHHPRPELVPSSPHAANLEKHDRVQHKDTHDGARSLASKAQSKVSSGSHGSSRTAPKSKKAGHRPSKGSL